MSATLKNFPKQCLPHPREFKDVTRDSNLANKSINPEITGELSSTPEHAART
jgi:hypothetical protein